MRGGGRWRRGLRGRNKEEGSEGGGDCGGGKIAIRIRIRITIGIMMEMAMGGWLVRGRGIP
jgi:hypothetical protein